MAEQAVAESPTSSGLDGTNVIKTARFSHPLPLAAPPGSRRGRGNREGAGERPARIWHGKIIFGLRVG